MDLYFSASALSSVRSRFRYILCKKMKTIIAMTGTQTPKAIGKAAVMDGGLAHVSPFELLTHEVVEDGFEEVESGRRFCIDKEAA